MNVSLIEKVRKNMHYGCLAVKNAATADHSVKSGSVNVLDGVYTRTTTVIRYFHVIHACRSVHVQVSGLLTGSA